MLVCFPFAGNALAGPGYRYTTGHKTRVWSDLPAQDNTLKWSGERDGEGYATGPGTLTFYRVNWKRITGSSIPTGKPFMVRELTGKMVKGKLEGPVEMRISEGLVSHARFAGGTLAGEWTRGSLPEAKKNKAIAKENVEKPGSEKEPTLSPETPGEGPSNSSSAEITQSSDSAVRNESKGKGESAGSDSLRSLIAPPSSLGKSDTRLSRAEAIRAADEEALAHGFNVGEYQRSKANYDPANGAWTVSYNQGSETSGPSERKHFSVSVEDKTGKASVAPQN